MQALIDTIHAALAENATAEQKASAAQACRTLLAAFEAHPGKPLRAEAVAEPTPTAAQAPSPMSPLAMIGKLSPDQALDLLIAKLRAAVPNEPKPGRARGFTVQLVPVPKK